MALDDLYTSLKLVQVFKDDEWTTDTHYSSAFDTNGYHQMLAVMTTGTVGVDGTVDIHFDESESSSGPWTEVPGSHFEVITPSNDDSAHMGRILLNNRKRYLRAHAVLTGHDSFLGVVVMLQPYDTSNSSSFDFGI